MTTNLDEIVESVETLRESEYPDLPKELIAQIIAVEAGFVEYAAEAKRRVGQTVEEYLSSEEA